MQPDPQWWEVTIRGVNLAVLGLTAGLCLGQSIWRRGLRRVALFAYAVLAAAVAYAQLDLFFGHGDDEPDARDWADLEPATRNLIRRHPDLLVAFERWRRTHHTSEDT